MHAPAALAKLQASAQNPQSVSVPSVVSHVAGSASQSAVPVGQGFFSHCPLLQLSVAEHLVPHVPQLFGSAPVCASQPFAACLSQSSNPALHVLMSHAPP